MMIKSSLFGYCSSPVLLEPKDLHRSSGSSPATARFSPTVCCSSKSHAFIPKLEPFSRTKFDRVIKDPPLIEKSENDIADYCSTLEGDESYGCWRAYFELKDLEREIPKSDVEKLILQAGGVKSLIEFIHGVSQIYKGSMKKESTLAQPLGEGSRLSSIPDGLPKTQAELEEEELGRMPDSPFTRMLRTKGKFPAWFSPAPDHETD